MTRYLVLKFDTQSASITDGAESGFPDEAVAVKAALSRALDAVSKLRSDQEKSLRAKADELSTYDRAGLPLREYVLDHDKLCRRVLADLNSAFRVNLRAQFLVVPLDTVPNPKAEGMAIEQIYDVVSKYEIQLEARGCTVKRAETANLTLSLEDKLNHALWMCQQIHAFAVEGEYGKANRWLGFVQGVLWANDIYTVDEMREDNRPSS